MKERSPSIVLSGVHHRMTSLEMLETVRRAAGAEPAASVVALGARGVVGVLTCHRAELYLEGVPAQRGDAFFHAWCGGRCSEVVPMVLEGEEAARHLLRVAAGLEAAVLGDDQVLAQLRAAYAAACRNRHGGALLHRLFHAAFRTGKRVRTETDLGRGGRSVAGEAVALISRRLGGLRGRRVLVLGSGEMARIAASRLARRGAAVLVSSRSRGRAAELAGSIGGGVVPWEWRVRATAGVDALVVATGAPGPVLTSEDLAAASSGQSRLLAVDLSMPRNLPHGAGAVNGVELVDLQRLAAILEEDSRRRLASVERAEAIVEEELGRWLSWALDRTLHGCSGRSREATAAV